MTDNTNPLIAHRHDSTTAFSGIFLVEDIDTLMAGYRSGDWIDVAIGGLAASMDTLAFVTDPLGQLLAWGVGWLIEHVKPLSDALDELAGDPDQIAAFSQTWRNVAGAADDAGSQLTSAAVRNTASWHGPAAEQYRASLAQHATVLAALSRAGVAMAEITEGAGLLVAMA